MRIDSRGSKYPFTRFFPAMTALKALPIVAQNNDKGPRKRENFCEPLSIYICPVPAGTILYQSVQVFLEVLQLVADRDEAFHYLLALVCAAAVLL